MARRRSKSEKPNDNIKKSERKASDDILLTLPGTRQLFESHKIGGKGTRSNLSEDIKHSQLLLSKDEFTDFENKYQLKLKSTYHAAVESSTPQYINWLWNLQLDHNILLYGIGDKKCILNSFHDKCLSEEDVIMIHGNDTRYTSESKHNKLIRKLLDTICLDFLKQPEAKECFDDLQTYCMYIIENLDHYYGRSLVKSSSQIDDADMYSKRKKGNELQENNTNANMTYPSSSSSSSVSVVDTNDSFHHSTTTITTTRSHIPSRTQSIISESYHTSSSTLIRPRSSRILQNKDHLDIDPEWGKRYTHAQSKLYLFIDSIDGEALRSTESISILCQLSTCTSITMVATANTLNTALLWSTAQLSQFKWMYFHISTFTSYPIHDEFFNHYSSITTPTTTSTTAGNTTTTTATNINYGNIQDQEISEEYITQAVRHVVQTLTSKHRELIHTLIKYFSNPNNVSSVNSNHTFTVTVNTNNASRKRKTIAGNTTTATTSSNTTITSNNNNNDNSKSYVILVDTLYELCKGLMIVKNKNELHIVLKELLEHKILELYIDSHMNLSYIRLLISYSILCDSLNVK